MAETSFPWEDIDTTETQYSTLFRTLNNGVNGTPATDELEVVAGFVGLTVDVEPGQAMVQGHYYINTVAKNIELDTADPVNDRIDTIVLRLDDIANEIVAVAVTGTPAVTPEPPVLTQTEPYGVFEFPLADVLVEAGAGTPGTITDRRAFMGERFGVWTTANRPDPGTGVAIGYNTTLGFVEFYEGTDWRSVAPLKLEDVGDVSLSGVQTGDNIIWTGSAWENRPGYRYVDTVYYTSSGTFVKADYPWLRAIRVRCIGAGGGGGGLGGTSTGSGNVSVSGGGGSGAYSESFITDIAGLDASVTVTRGAGGSAGGPGGTGGSGGASVFGSMNAGGGGGASVGAQNAPLSAFGNAGPFGTASGGDINVSGSRGGSGFALATNRIFPGEGASAPGGLGSESQKIVQAGNSLGENVVGFGNGGSGGSVGLNNPSGGTGGAGRNGIVIVDLFA